jgi:hypothetical protein
VADFFGIFFAFGCSLPPAARCSSVFFAVCCSSRPVDDFLLPPAASFSVAHFLLPQHAGFSEDEAKCELSNKETLYIPSRARGAVLAPDT